MVDLSKLEKIQTPLDIEKISLKNKAIEYLKETDWYYISQQETGKPMPDDIKEKREIARTAAFE